MADIEELRELVSGRIIEMGESKDYKQIQALAAMVQTAILLETACSLKELVKTIEETNLQLSRIEKRV